MVSLRFSVVFEELEQLSDDRTLKSVGRLCGTQTHSVSDFGNNNLIAFGVTKVEVNMKKINSKNMISLKDDILKLASTLFRDLKFILFLFW
jgi:hypothetical protein